MSDGPSYPLGVVLMLWGADLAAATPALLAAVRAMGYDSIELPLFGTADGDLHELGRRIAGEGLRCSANTALPASYSLCDASRHAPTVAFLQRMAAQARSLGSSVLCGPLLTPVGELPARPPGAREREEAVRGLAAAAHAAAGEGVALALEPLNRFESAFPNTVADAVALVDATGQPNLGLLLDTFHMNIEERSLPEAIRLAGPRLHHFHCSENDRGPVGSGHIPWPEVRRALDDAGYRGSLVVESFGTTIPAIARACCTWRPLAPSPEALADASAAYLRRLFGRG